MELNSDRPARLTGLRQAIYVLEQLALGRMPPQINEAFDSDSQLVKIWIEFLIEIQWIEKDKISTTGYSVTEKGKSGWLNWQCQNSSSSPPLSPSRYPVLLTVSRNVNSHDTNCKGQ